MKKLSAILIVLCLLCLTPMLTALSEGDAPDVVGYSSARVEAADLADVPNILHYYDMTENPPAFKITNAEGLKEFSAIVNSGDALSGVTVYLANDINMESVTDFEPIGKDSARFQGTFDGQGQMIENLVLKYADPENYDKNSYRPRVGLFGYVLMGTVKNVVLGANSSVEYTGKVWDSRVGAIVGDLSNYGTVDNCYSMATVICGGKYTGGIVGYVTAGNDHTITNCTNAGTVHSIQNTNWKGNCSVGGILGCHQMGTTVIRNCRNTGNIVSIGGNSASTNYGGAGGILGRLAAANCTITGCINNGEIDGGIPGAIAGGIIGLAHQAGSVTECLNYGVLKGDEGKTGLIGALADPAPPLTLTGSEDRMGQTDESLAGAIETVVPDYTPNEGNPWGGGDTDTDPEPPTKEAPTTGTPTSEEKPNSEEPVTAAPGTTEPGTEPASGGCSSGIEGLAVLLPLLGAAVTFGRKKERK